MSDRLTLNANYYYYDYRLQLSRKTEKKCSEKESNREQCNRSQGKGFQRAEQDQAPWGTAVTGRLKSLMGLASGT